MEFNDETTPLSLYDFLSCRGFNDTEFRLSLESWIDLITTKRDGWFGLPNELIRTLGYKRRSVLLKYLRTHYIDGTDFVVVNTRLVRVTRGSDHYKRDIRMRKKSFARLLLRLDTNVSRAVHDYMTDVDENVHGYDVYKKECELHERDALIREMQTEHECVLCIVLCTVSFVIFTVSMYLLYVF